MTFHLTLKQRPSCLITNVDLTLKNEGSSSYSLQVTGFRRFPLFEVYRPQMSTNSLLCGGSANLEVHEAFIFLLSWVPCLP